MKILVLIKQVPDSTTNIKIRADHEDIERAGVKMVVNPFDEFAIEAAVKLRETRKDVDNITALTIGPAAAAEALRTALAVGADEGVHLQDEAFDKLDELQTAALIAAVLKAGVAGGTVGASGAPLSGVGVGAGFDLVIRGKQEIDLDSGQTGPALAEFLDAPHVGAVTKLDVAADGKSLTANRRIEGADEVVTANLPAVLTVEKGLCEMRYPSLPNLMKAKKKPVKTLTKSDVLGFADIAANVGGTEMHRMEPPPARPPGKVLKDEPEKAVAELVRMLRQEAKVI